MDTPTLRAPRPADLDTRLVATGTSRAALLAVINEHDAPMDGTCPVCGWQTGRGQRACPSRVMARAVVTRKPVPAWLLHLIAEVPGALAPAVLPDKAERRAALDALPGLFDAPPRKTT